MTRHLFKMRIGVFLTCALFAGIATTGGRIWASEIQGQVSVQRIRSPGSIVVYVDAIPGKEFRAPAQHAVVDQKKMTFIPHVLVVLRGTTVDFLNSDSVGHNVYWPSLSGNKKLAHNLGTWPQGEIKSFTFTELGAAPLLCNVHTQMSGYVVVVPTPYFAVTDNQGAFAIKDVPPGHYVLKAWSEEGKPVSQEVEVTGGGAKVSLTVHR